MMLYSYISIVCIKRRKEEKKKGNKKMYKILFNNHSKPGT